MVRRKEPDPRLLKIWEEVGELIKSGDVDGIFWVWRHTEGMPRFGFVAKTDDLEEMLGEVRNAAMRARSRSVH